MESMKFCEITDLLLYSAPGAALMSTADPGGGLFQLLGACWVGGLFGSIAAKGFRAFGKQPEFVSDAERAAFDREEVRIQRQRQTVNLSVAVFGAPFASVWVLHQPWAGDYPPAIVALLCGGLLGSLAVGVFILLLPAGKRLLLSCASRFMPPPPPPSPPAPARRPSGSASGSGTSKQN
jgi:hypothetical protein